MAKEAQRLYCKSNATVIYGEAEQVIDQSFGRICIGIRLKRFTWVFAFLPGREGGSRSHGQEDWKSLHTRRHWAGGEAHSLIVFCIRSLSQCNNPLSNQLMCTPMAQVELGAEEATHATTGQKYLVRWAQDDAGALQVHSDAIPRPFTIMARWVHGGSFQ